MAEGMVKWFNKKKGFGFIANENGPDVFVHFSEIDDLQSRRLKEGDQVQYEIVKGEKGLKAAKVTLKPDTL